MPLRLSICAGLVILSGWVLSPEAGAQTRGTTGQNGQGSSSSMFGSGSSSLSSGFGSAGSSGGLGGSSMGSTGRGQTGMGQTGMGQTGQNRNATGFGQNQNNGFLGVNNNPNNFLGRNSQGQPNAANGQTGNLGRGNNRGNGGNRQLDNNLMNMLNGNGQQGGMGGQSQQPVIRPRQKVAFEYPQPKLDAVVSTSQTRLQKIAVRHPRLSDVKVSTEQDGTVVLRGSAPTEADAKVAESMLRLEPGVQKIRNELTFPPPRPENQ